MKKLFLTVSLLLWAFSLPAAIITVDVNGQGDYTTIQDGIDAAADEDTVMICDGTYTGPNNRNLTWDGNEKHITVMSVNGPDNCIIDGEDSANSCFEFDSKNITAEDVINGFTIKDFDGSAITSNDGCPIIVNNKIVNCREYNIEGAAINIDCNCYCAIINNEFINCDIYNGLSTWSAEGGAIRCMGYGWIKDNNFSDCTIKGIIDDGNQWTPEDVKDKGGAIWFDNSEMKISDNSFSNCFADEGGAIYAVDGGYINNNVIDSCSALQGGAIYSIGDVNIECNNISNCIGEHYSDLTDGFGGDGAGIYVVGSAYIANNIIHNNYGSINGVGISGGYSSGVEIVNNEFYGNEQNGVNMSCFSYGVSMALKGDDIIVSGNKIHNEKSYDNMDMIYVSGYNITVKDNVIYDNTNFDDWDNRAAIGCDESGDIDSINVFNNTIVNNECGIYCGYFYSNEDKVISKNNIVVDNVIGIHDNSNVANIQFCNVFNNNTDYQGCSPSTGCISTDPMFADPSNDDYSLIWNSTKISPCIDTGDPDMTWDADDTPPDIGAKTAVSHSYFHNQYDSLIIDNAEWISFPALNRTTDGYTEALGLLERQELIFPGYPEDDILNHVEYEGQDKIKFQYDEWQNDLPPDGNFHSYQGYKVQLQEGISSATIGITGKWEDESEPIALDVNKENWVGCYLEEPATFRDAFSSIWNKWESVYSEHWAVERPEPGVTPTAVDTLTANPGELYIITVYEDCQLIWNKSSPSPPPRTKEMTDYFTYDKKLDYIAVNIDTVYGDMPQEIAVYAGDECLGASKVNGFYPVQILAYPPDGTKNGNLDFMLYYGGKDKAKAVTDYRVYEHKVAGYVKRPLAYDREAYVTLRLNTKESGPDFSFGLLNNYPNPVNSNITNISFAPAKNAQNTAIKIYNVRGQLVRELDCNDPQYNKAGIPTVSWDCKDSRGREVQNGVYFYKLISGKKQAVKKMVIVK